MADNNLIYLKAIEKWGHKAQLEMLLEESIELALATRKFLREFNQERADDLCGEVADVQIMIEQLMFMYPEMREKVAQIKEEKTARLLKRILK